MAQKLTKTESAATVAEPLPVTVVSVTPAEPEPFTFTAGVRVEITFPGTPTVAFVPDAVFPRVIAAVRAAAVVDGPDNADTFTARITAARAAWDATGVPAAWDKIPANRAVTGCGVMDEQNRIGAAVAVSGVNVCERAISAVWRAFIPVTRCDFGARRYGLTSYADMAVGRQRSTACPGIPSDVHRAIIAASYARHTSRGVVNGRAADISTTVAR